MMKRTPRCGNPTPLSATAAQYGQGRLWVENPTRRAQGKNGWTGPTRRSPHAPRDPDGAGQNPEAERDYPAIHAAQDACENLFAMMDDELAKHARFSGADFGVGDIAVAPFVWNPTNLGLTWTPRPHGALA